MPADSARLIVEVVAGLIPGGDPEPEHTRKFVITSAAWEAAGQMAQMEMLADVNGRAQGYAGLLMLQPDRINWVRTDWVWL